MARDLDLTVSALRMWVERACADRTNFKTGLTHELTKNGVRVIRKRIGRLMQLDGMVARKRRRYKCTTMSNNDQPVAANILDRQFGADAPYQRWVGDATKLYIGESDRSSTWRRSSTFARAPRPSCSTISRRSTISSACTRQSATCAGRV